MFSAKQAVLIYEAMREAEVPHIKEQLPDELEGLDQWREEDEPSLSLYPYTIEGTDYWLIQGDTFPVWPLAKKYFPGFEWIKGIGGNPAHNAGAIVQSALDKEAFVQLMETWGWRVNEFSDVEEEEDE